MGALGKDGFNPSHIAAEAFDAGWVFQLTTLLLDAQIEHFMTHLAALRSQFVNGEFSEFFDLHTSLSLIQ